LKNKIDKKKEQKTIQLKEKNWKMELKKQRKLFVITIKPNLTGQL